MLSVENSNLPEQATSVGGMTRRGDLIVTGKNSQFFFSFDPFTMGHFFNRLVVRALIYRPRQLKDLPNLILSDPWCEVLMFFLLALFLFPTLAAHSDKWRCADFQVYS